MPIEAQPPNQTSSLSALRPRFASAPARAALISGLAIGLAALFVTTYTLALGNPVPHGIPFAVVGDLDSHDAVVQAVSQVAGPLLRRLDLPVFEVWPILTLQLIAAASFASLMMVLLGPWAIVPTWLFFVVLGNSSSGGAVAPPLLPPPFAFLTKWLPSGSTVTALRNAVYFPDNQHPQPIAVLATWAIVLFAAMIVVSKRRQKSPGIP